MMIRSLAFRSRGCIGAIVFVACASPALASIHAGDQLNVRVYNHPELSVDALRVDSTGAAAFPVAGSISVVGLESRDVSRILERRLAEYVPHPAVDIRDTTESAVMFVAGGPGGVLAYAPGETLATAIADVEKELQKDQPSASSPSTNLTDQLDRSRVDTRRVAIVRDGKRLGFFDMLALRKTGDPGPALLPNDTISFADKPVVITVFGDVAVPGKAYLWPDEPLSDAVAQAGGLKDSAATGRIELSHAGMAPRLVALGDPAFTQPGAMGDAVTFPTAPRVTVAGMIYNPGVTVLKNNFTLLSAMYSAGGISKWANLRDVQVTHEGTTSHYDVTKLTHGDVTQNPSLVDGDTVFVPEGHKIDFSQVFGPLLGAANLFRP